MTKRPGATSDNGFIFKKTINNISIKEKKIDEQKIGLDETHILCKNKMFAIEKMLTVTFLQNS